MLRYALGTTLPETKDADFNWDGFQRRVNGELADVLGNFVNRTLTFAERFFDNEVPPLEQPTDEDQEILDILREAPDTIGEAYDTYRMREAIFETIDLARTGNKYFNDTEPWHARKEDSPAAGNTIHVCLQLCASLSVLMEPVLPEAAHRLRDMLHLDGIRSSTPAHATTATNGDASTADLIGWDDARHPLLAPGHTLGTPDILFEKIDDDTMDAQRDKLGQTDTEADPTVADDPETDAAESDADDAEAPTSGVEDGYAELKDEIEFGDFMDLDLRLGRVMVAEPIPDADKLLRLDIDLGFEERQILAGIAEHMTPEEITGQRVVVVANLAPKAMFGLESQGMVLMAEDREGNLSPVTADGEPGSVVR